MTKANENKEYKGLKKIQYNAPVILTYTFLSLLVLLLNFATKGVSNELLFSVYRSPLNDPLTYFRLFGHVLGHINFEHLFNNFLIILLIGPFLEEKYGSKQLFLMILLTALITGVIHLLTSKDGMLLGASGVVFMMILLSSFTNLKQGRIPLTLIMCVIIFIGREILTMFLVADNVSRGTHIIGGFIGALFGFFFNRDKLLEKQKESSIKIEEVEEKGTLLEDEKEKEKIEKEIEKEETIEESKK